MAVPSFAVGESLVFQAARTEIRLVTIMINLILWHWGFLCSLWIFFQCHVKGNKLAQLDINMFLKFFCNFSAVFHLFPNWKKKKKKSIWRVENVLPSSNCHSTPRISRQEDRELHQMHHWSVHRQPLLDSTVMWERWKQSFVVSLLKGLNLFQCCRYVF